MTYNHSSIRVLEGLEAVRERPGMYIGSTHTEGLHHLLSEVVDNAIDEHLAGHATNIWVRIHPDGSVSTEDDGRGIPVDQHEKGMPTLRLIMTTLHAGGKFDNNAYQTSGGLHGVGSSVVNALSTRMDVTVYRDGFAHFDRYEGGGIPVLELVDGDLPKEPLTEPKQGTRIRFWPDATIFETVYWDKKLIMRRLHEKAYLNKGVTIHFIDERDATPEAITFHEADGLLAFLKAESRDLNALTEPFVISGTANGIAVEVAVMHVQTTTETVMSFTNGIPTNQGGTHVTGLRSGFTRLINSYVRDLSLHKDTFQGKELRSGLMAILSIKHPNPQFEGQTKGKLGSTDAKAAVEEVLLTQGREAYNVRVGNIKVIVDHAKRMQKIHQKEDALHLSLETKQVRLQVNGKLANCSSRKPKERELYIVEGDSAGGTAKQGRDRRTQAILPLRGKPLNVERASLKRALENEEVSSLYAALGAGVGESFDVSKLKFNKIIILSDADVDGSHIRTLLLTLLWRLSPDLVLNGHVYSGVPPLYKVTTSSTQQYLYSEAELNRMRADKRIKIKSVQRYKGLGEMDAEQLWETTMNPDTRILEQVVIEDRKEANRITDVLMGAKAAPRRQFIYDYNPETSH